MSTTENGTKPRYETVLNSIRRELQKIREAAEKLDQFSQALTEANHPAPAAILNDVGVTVRVALAHAKDVFREF